MERRFAVGDKVRVRPSSNAERVRWDKRDKIGTVVKVADLPANGHRIMVQWPDEEPPSAFESASQFDLA